MVLRELGGRAAAAMVVMITMMVLIPIELERFGGVETDGPWRGCCRLWEGWFGIRRVWRALGI